MKTSNLKLISVAAGLAMMGAAGSANAEAYAYSHNILVDGFFISNNLANTFGTPVNTSADSATLTGFVGVGFSDVGTGVQDATVATLGSPARVENVFTAIGPSTVTSYSGGDAVITQEQFGILAGQGIQAENVAESNVALLGSATGAGENSSGTRFEVLLSVITPGTVTFNFSFDPILRALLDAQAGVGSKAEAILAASLTITDDDTGDIVFNFAPDGLLNPLAGETADPYSLNFTNARFAAGDITIDRPLGFFSATTGDLAIGNYNVVISMKESTSVIRVAQVPEPASLALMGLALAGLGFTRRRKQA